MSAQRRLRSLPAALLAATALLTAAPAGAAASFGLLPGEEGFSVKAAALGGGTFDLAGGHPYTLTVTVALERDGGGVYSDGDLRTLRLELPAGLVENPNVVARCAAAKFHTPRQSPFMETASGESCPLKTQIGRVTVRSSYAGGETRTFGLFNLEPEPGTPARIGFNAYGAPVTFERRIDLTEGEYRLTLEARDIPRHINFSTLELTFWGNPWYVGHDLERGNCLNELDPQHGFGVPGQLASEDPNGSPKSYVPGTCSIGNPEGDRPYAYLTLPTSCSPPPTFTVFATGWGGAGAATRQQAVPLKGCGLNSYATVAGAQPTTDRASTGTGLEFALDVNQAGLYDNVTMKGRIRPEVVAQSQVKRAVLELPEGLTINPSVAAGLGVCTPAQYAAETAGSAPGAGCPNASKIGEVLIHTPLFERPVDGGLFLAAPYDNPFGTLLALYLVAKIPERGVMVKVAGRVDSDERTGRLVTTFDNLPKLPYARFVARLRSGQRAALATPAACGQYRSRLTLTPWIDTSKSFQADAFFQVAAGVEGGPCPSGPLAPFAPWAKGGMLNRNAGSYTPFYLRLGRRDGEQEITSYSTVLPRGLLGKIAGVPFCPEAAIAAAAANSGFAEAASSSCPEASRIGHTTTGYGFGPVLAYAPGGLYLAGPYNGSPLSIVAIDSATVGPFDLGVIIVRSAIRIDPLTSQVSIDSAGSDPIPHIIKGIPLHLRDIRVYISRPEFMLNPTNCDHFSIDSTLSGSGLRFGDPSDDVIAAAPSPFQVGFCGTLGFKPKVTMRLKGKTRRGAYSSLTTTVTPRRGDANIGRVTVTLPPTQFLAQEHIRKVCTPAQHRADRCPKESIYGRARAVTPLLDEPLTGPVYLRGSDRALPDLVASISGRGIDIDVVGRIDSKNGGMRATYDVLPDAPVTKFTLTLFGGRKALLVNSDNVCASPPATMRMIGQNNTGVVLRPRLVNPACKKRTKKKARGKRRAG